MSDPITCRSAMPILPIFHGSGAMGIGEKEICGLPYPVRLHETGLDRTEYPRSGAMGTEDKTNYLPIVFATSDPLLALAYTIRHRLPDASMVFRFKQAPGLVEPHVIFFTLKDGQGRDVTYEEWGEPLVLFEIEAIEGHTYLETNGAIHLASEWLIAGKAKAQSVACFKSLHELAMAGVQIYTMDGEAIGMTRRSVESRKQDWNTALISFDQWAKMMGRYTHPYHEDRAEELGRSFSVKEKREEMLRSGILTYLNPSLQGPLPRDSQVLQILDIRNRLNQLLPKIYPPMP